MLIPELHVHSRYWALLTHPGIVTSLPKGHASSASIGISVVKDDTVPLTVKVGDEELDVVAWWIDVTGRNAPEPITKIERMRG